MANLKEIEGVGESYALKLKEAGIDTTDELLEKGASPKGRKEIAAQSGISVALILEWVNHVDLFRVKGVGSEYADLLEEAGVDTIPELAQRKADHLLEKMTAVNETKKLVRRLPTLNQVEGWIRQAKELPRAIKY
ncbi:MAG: DUF4332 domain-containing protein [Coprothermobacterota bacterium]|nr:DUF4332 domain-containing protein [Coprothermobacterota bacterium]